MTSGKYFSNLLREETRLQGWLTALSSVVFFFALPIPCLFAIQASRERAGVTLNAYLTEPNMALSALLAGLSILAAISAYGYLFSRSRTDFYHALPLRRVPSFFFRYLAGVIAVLPAFLVNLALALLLSLRYWDSLLLGELLFRTGCYLILFLLSYATAVLAVTLCGNLFISLCAVAVLNGALPVLVLGLPSAFAVFHPTFYYDDARIFSVAKALSPIVQLFRHHTGRSLLLFALVAAALTALGCLAFRLRPSEGAGKALAFPQLHAPVKYLVMAVLTLFLAIFFQSIAAPQYATAWFCFGLLVGALLSHAVMEMLLEFDVTAFKQHLRGLAVFCAVTAAAAAFVICDPTGYDNYLPQRSELAGVTVSGDILPEPYRFGSISEDLMLSATLRDKENVDAVYDLIQNRLPAGETSEDVLYDVYHLVVRMTLTDGDVVTRRYAVPYEQAMACGDTLAFSDELITTLSPLYRCDPAAQTGLYVFSYDDLLWDDATDQLITNPNSIRDILFCAREETLSMTAQERREAQPVLLIRLTQHADPSSVSEDYFLAYDYATVFPVYDSCTLTLEMLGYDPDTPRLTESDFDTMYLILDGMSYQLMEVTDPADRQALLDAVVPYQVAEMLSYATRQTLTYEMQLSIQTPDYENVIDVTIDAARLPQGLLERYQVPAA